MLLHHDIDLYLLYVQAHMESAEMYEILGKICY